VQHLLLPQFPFSQTKCQNNFHGLGTTLQMVGLPIKRFFTKIGFCCLVRAGFFIER
jgi:hypothetical protein